MAKRRNSFSACSGHFTVVKFADVWTTPVRKNKTRRASPIAYIAPLIERIAFHMPPPSKFSGDIVSAAIPQPVCHSRCQVRSEDSVLPSYPTLDYSSFLSATNLAPTKKTPAHARATVIAFFN